MPLTYAGDKPIWDSHKGRKGRTTRLDFTTRKERSTMNYEKNDPKRLDALVKHLNKDAASDADKVTADDFTRAGADNCWKLGDNCGESWYVLTYDEAEELAKEKIANTIWGFNTDFVCNYIDTDELTDWERDNFAKHLEKITSTMCESANAIVRLLVGSRFDEFAEDAISNDGLGNFLADWDNEEIELGSGLYAYCE